MMYPIDPFNLVNPQASGMVCSAMKLKICYSLQEGCTVLPTIYAYGTKWDTPKITTLIQDAPLSANVCERIPMMVHVFDIENRDQSTDLFVYINHIESIDQLYNVILTHDYVSQRAGISIAQEDPYCSENYIFFDGDPVVFDDERITFGEL